jgi:hypothetical protein
MKIAASLGVIRVRTPRLAAVFLFAGAIVTSPPHAIAQGSLVSRAQPVGIPLATIITFGNQYEGGDELYDAKIPVVEVVRGSKAWYALKQASASNQPPRRGFEYLLARIRFEYSARTKPGERVYSLNPNQFTAITDEGANYPAPTLAAELKPELDGTLQSGDSIEGWVAFEVPRGDRSPLMMFQADTGSVFNQGGGSFFRLYRRAAAGSAAQTRTS